MKRSYLTSAMGRVNERIAFWIHPRKGGALFNPPARFRMKNIITSGFAAILLSAPQANAQLQDPYNAVQLSDNFDESQRRLTFYADNRDFCDYYLQISFFHYEGFQGMPAGIPAVVSHGKKQIMSYKVNEHATRYVYNYRYAMFRGNINKKPNVDFSYSLPVVSGEVAFAEATENKEGYQLAFTLPTDTAYACRGGIICDDNLKDHTAKGYKSFSDSRTLSQITMYHADGTFAEYVFRGKSLVYPGQNIKTGAPIAVINKTLEKYSVQLSVYFLDKNKVKHQNIGNKHTHFRPFFQADKAGKVRLESGKFYTCELTDEMLMQDMSKRERKKFFKNKQKETDEKK
jgi:hypothetical protein